MIRRASLARPGRSPQTPPVRLRLAVLTLVLGFATRAHARGLPPEVANLRAQPPGVYLITMGIGDLIWERHGHIEICVRNANPAADVCYNYGIGDFGHPLSMGWGFFRGANSFWAGKDRPEQMLAIYRIEDRTVWAQRLPLTDEQAQQMIAKLEHDVLEEHKYYAYDHFDDNCSTRIRNIIDDVTGGALSSMPNEVDGRTEREIIREGFAGMPVPLLITDIFMGRSTDKVPTAYELMFLPQYLRAAVKKKWGIEPVEIFTRKGPPAPTDGSSGRLGFALIILLMTAPAWATRLWGRFQRTGLVIAMAPYLLIGTILTFLAIISPLPYVRVNESYLLFLPLDVLVFFLSPARRVAYARGRVVMIGLMFLLMLVGVLKQPLIAEIPWPLVPMLVVGFWDSHVARLRAKPAATSTAAV